MQYNYGITLCFSCILLHPRKSNKTTNQFLVIEVQSLFSHTLSTPITKLFPKAFSLKNWFIQPKSINICGIVTRNIVKNSNFHTFFHVATVMQTFLKFLYYIQKCIWNQEISVFPQCWYGKSKSTNIFGQFYKEHCQTDQKQWFPCYFHFGTVTANLFEILNSIQDCIWNVKQSFSHSFNMVNRNPSKIAVLKGTLSNKIKNSDFHGIFYFATVTVYLFELLIYIQKYIWNLE